MELTIIIPIHNSEKYLKECMESALSQDFHDMEILCIDSGTDASFSIIEELRKKDSRIGYIYDSNSSYGHKINAGVEKAQGTYIMILESDDRLRCGAARSLYEIAERFGADMVDGDYLEFFTYKNREYQIDVKKYSNSSLYDRWIHSSGFEEKPLVSSGIWTALYRKSFLQKHQIRLNESKGAAYQDLSFLFLTGLLSESVYHVSQPVYEYRIDNAGSSMKDDRKVFEIMGECDFLKGELRKREIEDKRVWNLYETRKYEAYLWNYCRLSLKSREVFLEKCLEELTADFEKGSTRQFEEVALEQDTRRPIQELGGFLETLKEQEIVVFGAGAVGGAAISILLENGRKLVGICDNSEALQGTDRGGILITSVEETVKRFPKALYLIMSREYGSEMKKQLLRAGIKEEAVFIFA